MTDLDKMKILREPTVSNSRKIKLSYGTQNTFFSVQPKGMPSGMNLHYYWFAKIIKDKMLMRGVDLADPYIPKEVKTNVNVKNHYIDGNLYKKSQYLGNWEIRYIAITPSGLFSFKN